MNDYPEDHPDVLTIATRTPFVFKWVKPTTTFRERKVVFIGRKS